MTSLRRLSHLAAAAILCAVGAFLVLEATGVTGGRWRREASDALVSAAFPSWNLWLAALAGAALALLGIVMIAAQLAPPKKGLNTMHEVYKDNDGETRLRGRAAISAVRHELKGIEGVVEVDARLEKKRMHVELRVDDRANLSLVENDARDRLDHGFWINLGLADFALNLLITHHPKPPRVR